MKNNSEDAAWVLIHDSELLLRESSDDLIYVSALEIWQSEQNSSQSQFPCLADFNIQFSRKPYSLRLVIEPKKGMPFGCLQLEAFGLLGDHVVLSNDHKSDHIVIEHVWHAINRDLYDAVYDLLEQKSMVLGDALTIGQFVSLAAMANGTSWIEVRVKPNAKDISEAAYIYREHGHESSAFTGNLYSYQKRGSAWISFMLEHGTGVVLGDCMGLGKTIQVIKVICDLLETKHEARVLVVCPSALIENWSREIDKFSVGITKEKHVGPTRTGDYRRLSSSVVLTTYDIVRLDRAVLTQITWDLVILDEGQNIKNPGTWRTRTVKELPRRAGIVVTGTPFENHMTDLWSIFDFCVPGALGNLSSFKSIFKDDDESAQVLGEIIAPLMLRRDLEDAALDLPDFVPIPMPIELDEEEAKEYERRRQDYTASGASLGAINKLINDLAFPLASSKGISNLKYEYVKLVIDEVLENGEKAIIFADKRAAIGALSTLFDSFVPTFTLTGSDPVPDRQRIVDVFSSVAGSSILISNPVVGGAGLNITEANHVIHFSPQWNPAKVDQADARAYRNGQNKTVFSHYPYYVSTIEEYMWDKVYLKRGLSEQVVTGNKGEIDANDIVRALSMSPIAKRGF